MISHSDDDLRLPVSGENMAVVGRVVDLDDESTEKLIAARTTWEVSCWHLNFQTRLGRNKAVLSRAKFLM
jgi:hypothetical protein